jgi:hypothetical protein
MERVWPPSLVFAIPWLAICLCLLLAAPTAADSSQPASRIKTDLTTLSIEDLMNIEVTSVSKFERNVYSGVSAHVPNKTPDIPQYFRLDARRGSDGNPAELLRKHQVSVLGRRSSSSTT